MQPTRFAGRLSQASTIVETSFHWNYTTFLNFAAIALAGYLY